MDHPILEQIKKFPKAAKSFGQMFANVDEKFLDKSTLTVVKKGKRFITVEEKIDSLWVLLSGQVKVLDEHLSGDIYVFTRFYDLEIFGEMEGMAGLKNFQASLITETDSVFLNLPLETYISFLKENPDILYERTRRIVKRTLDEARNNRIYLRMEAIDRVQLYFINQYRNHRQADKCVLQATREEIANETGYSVKTINRTIQRLRDQGLLQILGHRIIIEKEQYLSMMEEVEKLK